MSSSMIPALGGLAKCCQFFVYLLTWNAARAKFDKKPIGSPAAARMSYAAAHAEVLRLRANEQNATVGLWITVDSGLFFLDIDRLAADYTATELAQRLVNMFPGAFVEWSSSKRGLHIVGRLTTPITHSSRNNAEHLEFYTKSRGIALNIDAAPTGCMDSPHDVSSLVEQYFRPRKAADSKIEGARIPLGDEELIELALNAKQSAAVTFGAKASFSALWRGEVEKNSENDAALASRLAFWTARDAERMARLMWSSGMVRDKWRRHRTYLELTIKGACDLVTEVYQHVPRDELAAIHPCTELANAYRLKSLHGSEMMSVDGIGWHVWESSGPWQCNSSAAFRRAFELGKVIQTEADGMADWVNQDGIDGTEEQKQRQAVQGQRMKWARTSESKAVIDHSLALAERLLDVSADKLDAFPMLVGCPSGVIDLDAIAMREHRREDRLTKMIACDYDPAALAPRWSSFINEVMGGDVELINYLQTLCGYILSGRRGEHLLPILYGTGANGKSTFLTTLQTLLGDYSCVAAPGLLVTRGGTEHPTGLASLQGRRLAIVSETGEAGRLNEEQVKLLTGGDRIAARRMRQDFYEFDATHVLVLQTNHKPRVVGNDEGIWRRLKLIPFTQEIPAVRRDPALPSKLAAELPGVLVWVVEGWRKYQANGFVEPKAVRAATDEYRSDSDHVGAFLAERCVIGPELTALAIHVYAAYKFWCEEAGERPLSQRTLGLRLAERPGIAQARTMHARCWRGLGVDHTGGSSGG